MSAHACIPRTKECGLAVSLGVAKLHSGGVGDSSALCNPANLRRSGPSSRCIPTFSGDPPSVKGRHTELSAET